MEQLALAISTGTHETRPVLHETKSMTGRRAPASEDKNKDADKDSEDSIIITGLYLDGASWSAKDHRLVEVGRKCHIASHLSALLIINGEIENAHNLRRPDKKAHILKSPSSRSLFTMKFLRRMQGGRTHRSESGLTSELMC